MQIKYNKRRFYYLFIFLVEVDVKKETEKNKNKIKNKQNDSFNRIVDDNSGGWVVVAKICIQFNQQIKQMMMISNWN